jgi:hypothetical protein
VVAVERRGRAAQAPAQRLIGEDRLHQRAQRDVHDLAGQEVDEPVQVLDVAARSRHELQRVAVGQPLDAPHHELRAAAVVLGLGQHAHRVALAEALVEHRGVLEHHAPDTARAVGELHAQERAAGARAAALLAQDGERGVHELPGREVADPDLLGCRHNP